MCIMIFQISALLQHFCKNDIGASRMFNANFKWSVIYNKGISVFSEVHMHGWQIYSKIIYFKFMHVSWQFRNQMATVCFIFFK